MNTEQANQAIVIRDNQRKLGEFFQSAEFKEALSKALPRHLTADRQVRVAITAMMRTPKLALCTKASLIKSLMDCSQFGLEPDGRRAHLIPYENRKLGTVDCQLIVDYKGLAELAMRSGQISYIHADVVCDADEFEYDKGELKKHKVNYRKPRGEMYAAYALVRFKDTAEKCEVMTREEIDAIRARSRAAQNGPWVTDYNEMAKKTCFRRLSKWLSLSPEFRDAIDKDDDDDSPTPATAESGHAFLEIPATVAAAAPANEQAQDKPTDDDQIPFDFPANQESSQGNTGPTMTHDQKALADFCEENKVTFPIFAKVCRIKNADSWSSWCDVPQNVCTELAKDAKRLSAIIIQGQKEA